MKDRRAMEVKVTQVNGVKFQVAARTHIAICDQPRENGGDDQGLTPPEFLLASLGSCAAYYAAEYLSSRKLAIGGVEVTVTAEKLKQPARLGNFNVQVACPVDLTDEQMDAMMRAVHHCLIHNTLLAPTAIKINLTTPQHVE
jgi:uncharacterized OsmC-like protein